MNSQTGFIRFNNQLEMVSFSSFVRSVVWLLVILAFAAVACALLLSGEDKQMGWGFQVVVAVLGGLGVASGIGAYNTKTVRTSAREYVEAEARGKAKGEAEATAERPALAPLVAHADKVEQNVGAVAPVAAVLADGDEREPNAFRDDERGEP
jgi:hypothetical protein